MRALFAMLRVIAAAAALCFARCAFHMPIIDDKVAGV